MFPFKKKQPQQPSYPPEILEAAVLQQQQARQLTERIGGDKKDFAEFILENKDLPPLLKEILPVYLDKEFALTNAAGDDQVWVFQNLLEASMSLSKILQPAIRVTKEGEMALAQLRALFYAKILRATGGTARDRALLVTTHSSIERSMPEEKKRGWLGGLGRGGK